ncbi:hypothetical protein PCE1_004379 [Barthelona sp. PCE]
MSLCPPREWQSRLVEVFKGLVRSNNVEPFTSFVSHSNRCFCYHVSTVPKFHIAITKLLTSHKDPYAVETVLKLLSEPLVVYSSLSARAKKRSKQVRPNRIPNSKSEAQSDCSDLHDFWHDVESFISTIISDYQFDSTFFESAVVNIMIIPQIVVDLSSIDRDSISIPTLVLSEHMKNGILIDDLDAYSDLVEVVPISESHLGYSLIDTFFDEEMIIDTLKYMIDEPLVALLQVPKLLGRVATLLADVQAQKINLLLQLLNNFTVDPLFDLVMPFFASIIPRLVTCLYDFDLDNVILSASVLAVVISRLPDLVYGTAYSGSVVQCCNDVLELLKSSLHLNEQVTDSLFSLLNSCLTFFAANYEDDAECRVFYGVICETLSKIDWATFARTPVVVNILSTLLSLVRLGMANEFGEMGIGDLLQEVFEGVFIVDIGELSQSQKCSLALSFQLIRELNLHPTFEIPPGITKLYYWAERRRLNATELQLDQLNEATQEIISLMVFPCKPGEILSFFRYEAVSDFAALMTAAEIDCLLRENIVASTVLVSKSLGVLSSIPVFPSNAEILTVFIIHLLHQDLPEEYAESILRVATRFLPVFVDYYHRVYESEDTIDDDMYALLNGVLYFFDGAITNNRLAGLLFQILQPFSLQTLTILLNFIPLITKTMSRSLSIFQTMFSYLFDSDISFSISSSDIECVNIAAELLFHMSNNDVEKISHIATKILELLMYMLVFINGGWDFTHIKHLIYRCLEFDDIKQHVFNIVNVFKKQKEDAEEENDIILLWNQIITGGI